MDRLGFALPTLIASNVFFLTARKESFHFPAETSSFAEPRQEAWVLCNTPTLLPPLTQVSTPAKVLRPLEVWGKVQPPGRTPPPGRDWEEKNRGSEEKGRQRDEEEGDGEAGKGEGSTNPVCGQHIQCRYLVGRWSRCLKGEKNIPGVYGSIPSTSPHSQMWAPLYMHTHT